MLIPSDPVHAFVDYPDVPVPNAPGGPLAGLTFAVKDIFEVAGYPTGCGNPVKRAESGPAKANAWAVQKLLDAGARFVGKTHTAELAFSLDGRNEHYGTPINPAAPGRVPGGSSSGSASAAAAGLVDIALGSDAGGSIRAPGSFCGLVGLRPTYGRTKTTGALPLAPSFDTVGWFARSLDAYERVGAVILGEDDPGPPLNRVTIAEDALALLMADADRQALLPAVDRVATAIGSPGHAIASRDGLPDWQQTFRTLQGYEAWRAHGSWVEKHWADLTPPVRGRFEVASKVTEAQAKAAAARRSEIRESVGRLVDNGGVIVLPTVPTIAPPLDSTEQQLDAFRNQALSMLCISGLSGFPQITMPMAKVDNCPLGLSLIGPLGRDRALIALARTILKG